MATYSNSGTAKRPSRNGSTKPTASSGPLSHDVLEYEQWKQRLTKGHELCTKGKAYQELADENRDLGDQLINLFETTITLRMRQYAQGVQFQSFANYFPSCQTIEAVSCGRKAAQFLFGMCTGRLPTAAELDELLPESPKVDSTANETSSTTNADSKDRSNATRTEN